MRIVNRYLTFDKNKKLARLLDKLGISFTEKEKVINGDVIYYSLEFLLFEDDPLFDENSYHLKQFKITPQVGTEFSKEDEDNAEWLWLSSGQFGYPQPENNYFELTYRAESCCLQCQVGKTQINPFRFKAEPKAKHSQFLGLNWIFDEIFVRDEAIKIFTAEKLGGIRYSFPVLHRSGMPLHTIRQMHVETILAPGLLTDHLEFEICQKPSDKKQIKFIERTNPSFLTQTFCGNKKYNFPKPGAIKFKREIFDNMPDFVKPYEWFGSGGSATRPILVSQKVRKLILKEKLQGASLTPILLI